MVSQVVHELQLTGRLVPLGIFACPTRGRPHDEGDESGEYDAGGESGQSSQRSHQSPLVVARDVSGRSCRRSVFEVMAPTLQAIEGRDNATGIACPY